MDILEYKLKQYEKSTEKNIKFNQLTEDYKDIADFITGKETIRELITKTRKINNVNGNPFPFDMIAYLYLQKKKVSEEQLTRELNEIQFYFSNVDKTRVRLLLSGDYRVRFEDKSEQIYKLKQLLPIEHDFEDVPLKKESLMIEILYTSRNEMNGVDFFNQVETSKDMPVVLFQGSEHSLCKMYTVSEDKIETPDDMFSLDDETSKEEVKIKYTYVPLKAISCRVKKIGTQVSFQTDTKRIMCEIPYIYLKERDLFVKNLVSHFRGIEFLKEQDESLITSFTLKWDFNRYYFLDMIFNNPDINSLVYMDESSNLFTKKKSFNLNFVIQTTKEDEKVQVSISEFVPEKDEDEEEFSDFVYVKIKNVKNEQQAEMFKLFLLRLFTYYNSVKDDIASYYAGFNVIPPKKTKSSTKKSKKDGVYDRTIFPRGYRRIVQGPSQPILVAKEIAGNEESQKEALKQVNKWKKEGYIVLKWPTIVYDPVKGKIKETEEFVKNRKVFYYFRGSEPKKNGQWYKYPSLRENILDDCEENLYLPQFNVKVNLEINEDWSVKIIAQHHSPKTSIPILVNAKFLFKPHEISHLNYKKDQEKLPFVFNNTLLFGLMMLFDKGEDVKQMLHDMVDNTRPELLKQQYWNKSIQEIKNELQLLKDEKSHLEYRYHARMIEEYFNINLFSFQHDEHDMFLEIPNYKQMYVYEDKIRPTVCVIRTEIKANLPYYKVILLDNNGVVSDDIRQRLFNLRRSIVRYVCEPLYFPVEWKPTGQIIDLFGKTRVIQFEKDDKLVQVETPRPLEPLNLPTVTYKKSTGEYPIPLQVYQPPQPTHFEIRKKISKVIKEFGRLLYYFDTNIKQHFIIENVNYKMKMFETYFSIPFLSSQEEVVEYFSNMYPFLFRDNKLVIENEEIFRGLMAYIKTNRYTEYPHVLKELCCDVSDFETYNPYEVIFVENDAIRNIQMVNKFKIYTEYQEMIDPYIYRDNYGKLYLFQNVLLGDYGIALRILSQWNSFKINTGYYSIPLVTEQYVKPIEFQSGMYLTDKPGIAKIGEKHFFYAPFE